MLIVTFVERQARADLGRAICAALLISRATLLINRPPRVYHRRDDATLAHTQTIGDELQSARAAAPFVQAFEQHPDDAVAA